MDFRILRPQYNDLDRVAQRAPQAEPSKLQSHSRAIGTSIHVTDYILSEHTPPVKAILRQNVQRIISLWPGALPIGIFETPERKAYVPSSIFLGYIIYCTSTPVYCTEAAYIQEQPVRITRLMIWMHTGLDEGWVPRLLCSDGESLWDILTVALALQHQL